MLVLLSNVLSSLHNPLTQAFCPITVSMHYYPFFSSSWKPSSCKLQGRLVVNGWHVSREIWGKWRWFRKYESMHSTHFSDLIFLRRLPKKVNFGWLVFYQSHNIAHDFHSGWIIQLFEENIKYIFYIIVPPGNFSIHWCHLSFPLDKIDCSFTRS